MCIDGNAADASFPVVLQSSEPTSGQDDEGMLHVALDFAPGSSRSSSFSEEYCAEVAEFLHGTLVGKAERARREPVMILLLRLADEMRA